MLVLSRKLGEEILIGDGVRLIVYHISRNRVRLGIVAPDGVPIYRDELTERASNTGLRKKVAKARQSLD